METATTEDVWEKPLTPYMKEQLVMAVLRRYLGHPELVGYDEAGNYWYQVPEAPERLCAMGWLFSPEARRFASQVEDGLPVVRSAAEESGVDLDIVLPEGVDLQPDFPGRRLYMHPHDDGFWDRLQALHDSYLNPPETDDRLYRHVEQNMNVRLCLPRRDPLFGHMPLEDLEEGHVYRVDARNFSVGIWRGPEKGFQGKRLKFSSVFIDNELHWDSCDNHGTAKPLYCLCLGREDVPAEHEEEKLLEFLSAAYKKLPREAT